MKEADQTYSTGIEANTSTEGDAVSRAGLTRTQSDLGTSTGQIEAGTAGVRLLVGADFIETPERLKRAATYAQALGAMKGLCGRANIALDVVSERQDQACLAVAAMEPTDLCIPDWTFLAPEHGRDHVEVGDWAQRPAVAWWRGDLAGDASALTELMRMARVRICVASRFLRQIDAKLTTVGRFATWEGEVENVMRGLDLLATSTGPPSPRPRYLLDIEGDPFDRIDLASRLMAGCVVRVGKPARLWFDDRIRAAGGLIEIAADGDVAMAIDDLERKDRGRQVWNAGASVLAELTEDVARAAFRQAVTQALDEGSRA